jgi:hypothetical protein
MSTQFQVDWDTAQADDDDVVVRLADDPPDDWWAIFTENASAWETETRGQTWDGMALHPDGAIRFESVEAGTKREDLRAYLDGLVETVNTAYSQR